MSNQIWPKTQWANRTRNWLAGDYEPEQLELPGMPQPPPQPDDSGARLLPFLLHNLASKDGLVSPGRKYLADVAGVSVNTIRRWMRVLKKKELLVVPPGMSGYRGKATTYLLNQPAWLIVRAEAKERGVTHDPPIDVDNQTKGGHPRPPKVEKGGSPMAQRGVTHDPPYKGNKDLLGNAAARHLTNITNGIAAGMDADNPLTDLDDPGCDTHKKAGTDKACGGCRDYRLREQRRESQRQREAERRHSEQVRQSLDEAEANAVTGPEAIGIVERKRRELEAAEPPEPDNPDPQRELTPDELAKLSPMMRGAYLASRRSA